MPALSSVSFWALCLSVGLENTDWLGPRLPSCRSTTSGGGDESRSTLIEVVSSGALALSWEVPGEVDVVICAAKLLLEVKAGGS